MKHFEKEVLGKTEWQVNKDPGKTRILISFSSCTDLTRSKVRCEMLEAFERAGFGLSQKFSEYKVSRTSLSSSL